MRRNLARTLLLFFAVSVMAMANPGQAQAAGYSVVVNGVAVQETQAELQNGQLMVSVRPFVEAMGGSVTWLASAKRASLFANGSQMALWVGTYTAFQNDQPAWTPVKPYILNDRMMVPAWWLAVRFGAQVSYSGSTLSVTAPWAAKPAAPQHPFLNSSYYFPYPAGAPYDPWTDTWSASRYYSGTSFGHEGTDILAPRGTPIVAVTSGTVIRYGWNTLGGYRVTIQLDDDPNYKFYYAHMDRYASGIYLGAHVKAGQLLGYVGNTGEGPERTEGNFPTHLHFGIYGPDWTAINPYTFLRHWEAHKITL